MENEQCHEFLSCLRFLSYPLIMGRFRLRIIISLSSSPPPPLSHPPLSVWRKPRVQLHAPFQTFPAVNLLTCTALTVTGTTAVAPQAPGCLLCPLQAKPASPGHSVHATNQLAWLYVSKRKKRTRGAKPYQTVMNSLQTYKTRR